jgi:hypothetical protein
MVVMAPAWPMRGDFVGWVTIKKRMLRNREDHVSPLNRPAGGESQPAPSGVAASEVMYRRLINPKRL